MNFASDNWAGAHSSIVKNLSHHASGFHQAYGDGPLDKKVKQRFAEIFECNLEVFFVATGTAANSLAAAAVCKPGGITLCHSGSHMFEDECGAPDFFSSGRLRPISGSHGKMDPVQLEKFAKRLDGDFLHAGRATMVSITQATELGTIYSLNDIGKISEICAQAALPLHMDGSRFANALATLDVSPAQMTWKAGVDMLTFGGTKNGCWCAEALIVFDPQYASELAFHRKRAGHLFSKSRFIAAQFEAYLEDDMWLKLARHANAQTAKLATLIDETNGIRLAWRPQANEIFAITGRDRFDRLKASGLIAAPWIPPVEHESDIGEGEVLFRMVTSYATKDRDITDFAAVL